MPRSLSNLLTLILAVVGGAVALLLTVEHYTHVDIGCTKTGQGCAATLNSDYGHIGPVPTALFGLGMYAAIAGLCLLRSKQLRVEREREAQRAAAYAVSAVNAEDSDGRDDAVREVGGLPNFDRGIGYPEADNSVSGISLRRLDLLVWLIALAGFGLSMWLQYVAIYQLQSFCKYCFTSAVVISLIFALASRDHLLDGRQLTGEQKMIGFVLCFIAILGAFIIGPDIWAVAHKPPPPIDPTPKTLSDAMRNILVTPSLHVKGSNKATHTLIEFADYQCGHCSEAAPAMEMALHSYPSDVRVAFRNFPLPGHKWARDAAAAAEAADKQGKFWEMHDLLFQHTKDMEAPTFDPVLFDTLAKDLHLNVKKFDADRSSGEIKKRVQADMEAGEKADVQSTPTFYFVSPTKITKFAGRDEMQKFMRNPKSDAWK